MFRLLGRLSILTIVLVGSSACDRIIPAIYQTATIGDDVLIVNSRTGTAYRVQGRTLFQMDMVTPDATQSLEVVRQYYMSPVQGMKFSLKSKFADESLLFRLEVSGQTDTRTGQPTNQNWQNYFDQGNNTITLRFNDNDGFAVKTADLILSGGGIGQRPTRVVDSNGETSGFLFEGRITCNAKEYLRISQSAEIVYRLM